MRPRHLIAAVLVILCAAAPAGAETTQQGDLITAFDGGLSPRRLPRERPAPIAVRVAGDFRTADGAPLPQLRTIRVAINRAGRIYDAGLPSCEVAAIQPATERAARALCRESIVGSGHVAVEVRLPSQDPFMVRAKLLAFKGPVEAGSRSRKIVAQVYARDPPGAFVLTFQLRRRRGVFGTVIRTALPRSAWGWAYLTHFDMTLERRYRHAGRARSYVSAACSAPAGFPGAIFPFARATYGFAGGRSLTTAIARSCRVR